MSIMMHICGIACVSMEILQENAEGTELVQHKFQTQHPFRYNSVVKLLGLTGGLT